MGEAKRRLEHGAKAEPMHMADAAVSVLYNARLLVMMRTDPPRFRQAMDGLGALYHSKGLDRGMLSAAVKQSDRLPEDEADAAVMQQRQGAGLTLLWLAFRGGLYHGRLQHWNGGTDLVLSAVDHADGLKLDLWAGSHDLPELPKLMQ